MNDLALWRELLSRNVIPRRFLLLYCIFFSFPMLILLHIIQHAYSTTLVTRGYRTEHSLLSTSQTPPNKRLYLLLREKKNQTLEFISNNHKTTQTQTHLTKLYKLTNYNNNGQSSCTLQQHGRRCPLP